MNKILVTGVNGQLGSELRVLSKGHQQHTFFFTDVAQLDITNHESVKVYLIENKIDTIFNCAAYTAVDNAEDNFELSNKINHLAVHNFAVLAKQLNLKLIHISTDYVFDGEKNTPYDEEDTPNPKSVYGDTKLAGENAILKIAPKNTVIIRTSWVYSSFGNNFVKTMLRLSKDREVINVIADQVGTPTYAKNLAEAILILHVNLENNIPDIVHYSNEGVCSWYDFAKAIFELKAISIKLDTIESSDYPTKAKRPFYSVLNKSKIKSKYNVEVPYWRDSLKDCLT
ncbi:dTDP-4-dehydrorhamnose reductase [Flavobacteriaceae bacterium]|nr:dTDP-4-dehydrorhamnose reductase [Flavobacteriaceae bacterium]